ncbi:MAG: ribbon-helix-helix protein, CopG family [Acidobacteria bacterium]|nr:ribbon-helix-helix protein, CopG family [Acidobacteriota bacterium]MYH28683.1 ribbon-helix-helix protein, CopG family [Acidobacteriota bacterium]MYK90511.1 ribbon-helix-helix protein, CopG family [Acidobacteriota bacterium]
MSTTVHLPADLLASVDREARALAMSRNRYIIRALEQALATETGWSAEFVEELASARSDIEGGRALEELRASVAASRTRKGPPTL